MIPPQYFEHGAAIPWCDPHQRPELHGLLPPPYAKGMAPLFAELRIAGLKAASAAYKENHSEH